jgi:hypothetical protein
MKTLLRFKRFWLLAGLFFGLLVSVNGLFFFTTDNETEGLKLGQRHKPPTGASLAKDIYPGGAASLPAYQTVANDMLVFAAYNSSRGETIPGLAVTTTIYLPLVFNINAIVPWISQPSNTGAGLKDISCPSPTLCFVVGDGGLILKTTNGGAVWDPLNSNTGVNLAGVSCPTTTTCFAVGDSGTILKTTDGSSWKATPKLGNTPLYGVYCPTISDCILVGRFGRVQVLSGDALVGSFTLDLNIRLLGVYCSSLTNCIAVGEQGRVYTSTSPATHWTLQNSGVTQHLQGVTCVSSSDCYAVGTNGVIRATHDGGISWKSEPSNTTTQLNDVTCANATVCRAVGQGGVIRARS